VLSKSCSVVLVVIVITVVFCIVSIHTWVFCCCWLHDRKGVRPIKNTATKIPQSLFAETSLMWSKCWPVKLNPSSFMCFVINIK